MTDGPKPAEPGEHPAILVSDRQERRVDVDGLRELAVRVLDGEGIRRAELSVSFVGLAEMTELHERYAGEPGATDVLSFAQDDGTGPDGTRVLGDVVIAPEVAARSNPDLEAELRLLLVHGILHLLGYDHEEESDRARMWARQESYAGVRVP